ncbi:Superfamily II DNA helicase [Pseudomonas chlororaphis subsp. aureofaciens]|uniref:Superfamily II DNA helicase n=2 Tax=Pseudomonas chlororaphis TaxID=587753 RepID=A0AAD0ZF73_9PSED|nr:Superfamily II DNA helicase [Pseudomonas chlororaphis subsp. aureofaciens]AZE27627.1 Superfamily II DNA helicase [Pseudomonas chlororaphis subsp. aureofaciens]SDT53880.1 Zn-binding Pro-Ala-Ala-Arg (PAAR) domain-containing protein, incolved in TypeVI secretion [Pseudomonas chlororaphis]SUD22445.1 Rhs element Vgr protein [Pseudomonas chlororaphis]
MRRLLTSSFQANLLQSPPDEFDDRESCMAKPAARITDPTSCPIPGHGAKAIASGSTDVFFDGLSAARKGDTCTCGSSLASAVSATVFINGKNAALVDTVGTHGDVVIAGSATVIIGDSHSPAPFIPPVPLSIQKTYGQSFSITNSETGDPLAFRDYVATIDGVETPGTTDANGIAHLKTATPGAKISLHIKFNAPARTLHELSEEH